MKRLWGALSLVLALIVVMPKVSAAQSAERGNRVVKKNMSLGQNYPNPMNPKTTFPFSVGDPPVCSEPGKQFRVSLTIYNVLRQVVAIPVVQAGGATLKNLLLTCGEHTAFWDGKDHGREAASGVYIYILEVDGVSAMKRFIVAK